MMQGKKISVRGILCWYVCEGIENETSIIRSPKSDEYIKSVFKNAGSSDLYVVPNKEIEDREKDTFVLPEYLQIELEQVAVIEIP